MDSSVKSKTVKGLKWTGLESVGTQILTFIIGIVIARQLAPGDYGILGMLAIFIGISQTFLDSGFGRALVQKKDVNDDDFSTAFFFNLVVGLSLYTILFFSAPFIADFYNLPILVPVTRIYLLTLILNALSMVQVTRLIINLDFKTTAKLTIMSQIVAGVTGIVMAYAGCGVWALVGQNIMSGLVYMLSIWYVSKWKPKLTFKKKSFNALFGFGSKLLASSLINSIYNNLATIVIGKAFHANELGLYTRANLFSSLPTSTITNIFMKVNYPVLAKFQDDDEKLLSMYSSLLRAPLFILFPVLFGLACLASPIIYVLLGEKWLGCSEMLVILCLGAVWGPLTTINLNLLYVKGRTDLVLKLEFIKKPIAFLMLLSAIPFGIYGMVTSIALYNFVAFTINCHYTGKMLGYGFSRQIRELLPIICYSAVMALVVLLSTWWIEYPIMKLLLGVSVGIIVYISVARMSKDRTYDSICNIIIEKVPKLGFLHS